MPFILFFIFVAVPLVEISLFIFVGERVGIGATVLLVILTAILGTFFLRMQGLSVFTRAQKAMAEGQVPVDSVIDGVCLLMAGAFLLTPGFLTDSIGFLLFIPQLRRAIAGWIFKRMLTSSSVHFESYSSSTHYENSPPNGGSGGQGTGPVIEGEFERTEESPDSTNGHSPWKKDD